MSVTPDFIGQIYKDTNTGNLWRANSLTPGDWTLELQNMQVFWTPRNQKLSELMDWQAYFEDMSVITDITLTITHSLGSIYFAEQSGLRSISCPNLVDVDVSGLQNGINIESCPNLTSVSLPVLIDSQGGLLIDDCPLLTTVDLSNWIPRHSIPYNVGFRFRNDALNVATVDSILARCVADATFTTGDFVYLDGGTSASPSSVGPGSDYAILIARGCTVLVN